MKSRFLNISKTQLLAAPRLALAAALLVLAAQTTVVRAKGGDDGNPTVLPPSSHPYGKSYSDWSASWWQWLFSLETTHSPQFNTADCSTGQSGQVWFLPGTFNGGTITQHCTIPEGKSLFFPIINAWADNTGCPPTIFTTAELRALAKGLQDQANGMSCTIDGVAVHGLADPLKTPYRVQSPVFSYTLPPNNNVLQFFGLSCYTDPTGTPITVHGVVADGAYIMFGPLSKGHHTIHVAGALGNPMFFSLDITYLITVVDEDLGNRNILPPESKPYGKTYGEWSVKHWQWLYSLPVSRNPLLLDGHVDLRLGQPAGPVWFLGGSFAAAVPVAGGYLATANRIGTVPEGKALFFPILDAECSTAEGNGTTESQLRACAVSDIDPATGLACEIDGKPVQNLTYYRFQSPPFTWGPLPPNNLFQDPVNFPARTTSPSVSDGYFLMLEPLSVGHHTLHFTGGVPGFTLDITYHLSVTGQN